MPLLTTPRRRLIAAAAALASVPALVVAAQPLTATGSTAGAETLTFRSKGATFRFIDIAPKGEHPTAGDSLVLTNGLYKSGDRIGTLHATCVVTRRVAKPGRTPLLCQGVYRLPGGDLFGPAAIAGNSDRVRVAITGGTRKYAGASGEAVEDSVGGNVVQVTVTLQ